MKRYILKISMAIALGAVALGSCNFLDENPKTFLSPANYYNTEAQVVAAVNGIYTYLDDVFNGDIERGTQTYLFMDYLAGYAIRPYAGASTDIYQTQNLTVEDDNNTVLKFWQTAYQAIENCNSVIEGITGSVTDERGIMDNKTRDKLLGEAYFLRAHFYFNLVRLFGEVPLKIESTKSLNLDIALSSQEDVYAQIEADLAEAEKLMTAAGAPMSNGDGDELSEHSNFAHVYAAHSDIFQMLRNFHNAKPFQTVNPVRRWPRYGSMDQKTCRSIPTIPPVFP